MQLACARIPPRGEARVIVVLFGGGGHGGQLHLELWVLRVEMGGGESIVRVGFDEGGGDRGWGLVAGSRGHWRRDGEVSRKGVVIN